MLLIGLMIATILTIVASLKAFHGVIKSDSNAFWSFMSVLFIIGFTGIALLIIFFIFAFNYIVPYA